MRAAEQPDGVSPLRSRSSGADTESDMAAISRALVALHKEQFGRGPSKVRTHYAGPDAVLCVLEDALLPAERKLVEIGNEEQVRETRVAFQTATEREFVAAVEQVLHRKVRAFTSGVDPRAQVVFEVYLLEPGEPREAE